MPDGLEAVRDGTRGVYERQAAAWDRARAKAGFERAALDRFLATVPAGGSILDVGCGTGAPGGKYLADHGRRVVGLDYSAPMLAIAAERFPERRWIRGDMRTMDLGERFDGVMGWDSFFHLTMAEQRAVIPILAWHLRPAGSLLLTVGHIEGEVTGEVGGEAVYHASLAPEAYRRLLAAEGFAQIDLRLQDPECGGRSVLLATRP